MVGVRRRRKMEEARSISGEDDRKRREDERPRGGEV